MSNAETSYFVLNYLSNNKFDDSRTQVIQNNRELETYKICWNWYAIMYIECILGIDNNIFDAVTALKDNLINCY